MLPELIFPLKNSFLFVLRVSLCSPGCPQTPSVDQAGLELKNLLASAYQLLGLKACNHHCLAQKNFLFFFFLSTGGEYEPFSCLSQWEG